MAYLEVRVNAGQPQLYGTQLAVTGGEFGPRPIEDTRQYRPESSQLAGFEGSATSGQRTSSARRRLVRRPGRVYDL
jgi:hypothetical protein